MIEDEGWLYLEPSDVLAIAVAFDIPPVQDVGKIEAACARPRQSLGGQTFHRDVAEKAGALGWGLTRAHAFVDGNKRVGAIATLVFCHVNGFDLALTPGELVALFLQIAKGEMDQTEVAAFLRSRVTRAPTDGV